MYGWTCFSPLTANQRDTRFDVGMLELPIAQAREDSPPLRLKVRSSRSRANEIARSPSVAQLAVLMFSWWRLRKAKPEDLATIQGIAPSKATWPGLWPFSDQAHERRCR